MSKWKKKQGGLTFKILSEAVAQADELIPLTDIPEDLPQKRKREMFFNKAIDVGIHTLLMELEQDGAEGADHPLVDVQDVPELQP